MEVPIWQRGFQRYKVRGPHLYPDQDYFVG